MTQAKVPQMKQIPLDTIREEPGFNLREDFGDLDELAQSLSEIGQQEPMKVRPDDKKKGSWVLIDGHRRMRAFTIAKDKYKANFQKGALCILEEAGTNEERRIVDLFALNSGKPLTPIEQAVGVKKLVDFKWSHQEIAKKIGKSQAYVSNILKLNASDHAIREAVKSGTLSTTAAVKLATAPKAKQEAVLSKIADLQKNPVGEKKDTKPGSKAAPAKKAKKKISIATIEKEIKGETATVSSKSIRDLITRINAIITDKKMTEERAPWVGVRYGLELALGKTELDPAKEF